MKKFPTGKREKTGITYIKKLSVVKFLKYLKPQCPRQNLIFVVGQAALSDTQMTYKLNKQRNKDSRVNILESSVLEVPDEKVKHKKFET